jgi:hypothetical protein
MRGLFDFRNALQRRGERGLPNLWAWGGCEAEPPGLTLVIILFRAEIETSGDEFSRTWFRLILKQAQSIMRNFLLWDYRRFRCRMRTLCSG